MLTLHLAKRDRLRVEIKSIEELAELDEGEASSRWALDALAHYRLVLAKMESAEVADALKQESLQACKALVELDPDRQQRYKYLMQTLV